MKCLRCGYCCVAYMVILPDGRPKPDGEPCPHLRWEGEQARCEIHGQEFELDGHRFPWKETPCGRHGQIGKPEAECRMGAWMRSKGKTGKDFVRV